MLGKAREVHLATRPMVRRSWPLLCRDDPTLSDGVLFRDVGDICLCKQVSLVSTEEASNQTGQPMCRRY